MGKVISNNKKLAFLSTLVDLSAKANVKTTQSQEELLVIATAANYQLFDGLYNQVTGGSESFLNLVDSVEKAIAQIAQSLADTSATEAALRPKFREVAEQAKSRAVSSHNLAQRDTDPGESAYDSATHGARAQAILVDLDALRRDYISQVYEQFTLNKTEDIEGTYKRIGKSIEDTCNAYAALVSGLKDYASQLGIDISKLEEEFDYSAKIASTQQIAKAKALDEAATI